MNDSTYPAEIDAVAWLKARERASRNFDEVSAIFRPYSQELEHRLGYLGFIPQQILLIGAWDGLLANHLTERFPNARLTVLEMSAGFRELARNNCKKSNNINWLDANTLPLPVANESVDLLLADAAIPPYWNWPQFITECSRVLMPRGYLSLSTLGEGSFEALRLACDSAAKPSHVHDFIDIKSLGMAFLNAGLTDPVVDVERVNLSYRSWTRFHKDMKAMGMINTRKDRARTLTGAYAYRQWMNRLEATDSTPLRIQLELLFAQGFKSTGLPPKRVSRTEQVLPFPKRGRL